MRDDEIVKSVPFLADIPLIGELFKSRSNDNVRQTLFAFIRPVLLRDPSFEDLISLSRSDARRAKISHYDKPFNQPKRFEPSFYPGTDVE